MEPLLSEQYAYALENSEPSNYTMRPNIIDHLTYDEIDEDTGEKTLKRLSVFACHLYIVMRSIAGNENISWKNTKNLAALSNMSEGMIVKCKRELQNKFHQLDGEPLIVITEHKKCKIKDGTKLNGYIYHKTLIKNIWGYNRAFFLLKKMGMGTDSQDVQAKTTDSQDVQALPGTDSPNVCNKTSCSKTPLFKEQQSTAPPNSVCSSNIEAADVSVDKKTRMFNWLMQIGCDIMGATSIIQHFSEDELHKASGYVQKMIIKMKQKNNPITNIIGYLRKTLEGRYWESNVS